MGIDDLKNDGVPASFFETQIKNNMNNCVYTFLNDSYHGNGGYADGSYIIAHPREDASRYKRRQLSSYYLNYIRPIVNAHVNPVFRVEPTREHSSNAIFSSFLDNVDGKQNNMDEFMKKAAHLSKLHGKCFILVDNFENPENYRDGYRFQKIPVCCFDFC